MFDELILAFLGLNTIRDLIAIYGWIPHDAKF
jgi:hypothetical protein